MSYTLPPYLRHAAVYAKQAIYGFHGRADRILGGEDGITRVSSKLAQEREVYAAIRDDIRAVAFSSWHEECGDIRHHGRHADCVVLRQLIDFLHGTPR